MTIIEYVNSLNITVQFDDGYIIDKKTYDEFSRGTILSPNDKTVCGVGVVGEKLLKIKMRTDIVEAKRYKTWRSMLQRCYSKNLHKKHPTYIGCTVCEEWHNFQVFKDWYDENYYEVENEQMHLDKDIINKGNKKYSPETCVFVPKDINALFTKSNAARGDFPIGVTFHKQTGKFESQCCGGNKKLKHLGLYTTKEDAFYKYKQFKEKTILKIANEYKDKIPEKLYIALCNYRVEITD